MKHTFSTIVVAAMAMLTVTITGCSKEESNNDNSAANVGNITETAEWVDLGLPSGLLWAKWNIGANAPEGYGDHFAWGETRTKEIYEWDTYAFGGANGKVTKYCVNAEYGLNGFTDNLTTLQPSDDVATVRLGNGAHIPTSVEWSELLGNTTVEWDTLNGVFGRTFSAANGNTLFLPAAGWRYASYLDNEGRYGHYWSSTVCVVPFLGGDDEAYCFYFNSDGQSGAYECWDRSNGFSVRAVRAR